MFTKQITSAESLIKPPISDKLKAGCVLLKTDEEVGEHVTTDKEELLIILQGKAQIICDTQKTDVEAGSVVFIAKNKKHNVINRSKELLKYVYIVTPVE